MSELDPAGIAAARRYCRWNLGDGHWADAILRAYNNPAETNAMLNEEQK